jgi:UDP-N-acetylglucosamine 4,6-dehydratase
VPAAEYNPFEFIKTNIFGAQNVIEACLYNGVRRVVALSTDKAAAPINLYGATKLCSDKLFIAANNIRGKKDIIFSVVRYGNVMGSRGSVIPFFQNIAALGKPIPITDLRMTRFWITIESAVNFVIDSLEMMTGGELYVPKIPSMKITDLANAVAPGAKIVEIGMRPGEKLHEEMISADDSRRTIILKNRYVVTPVVAEWGYRVPEGNQMPDGHAYRSDTNDLWMSESDIMNFIQNL